MFRASLIWVLWPAYVFVNQVTHNDSAEDKDKQNHRGVAKKLEHLTLLCGALRRTLESREGWILAATLAYILTVGMIGKRSIKLNGPQ